MTAPHQHERHASLLKYVAMHGAASAAQLAEWLHVSRSTIWTDIRVLVKAGQLERTSGGAALPGTSSTAPSRDIGPVGGLDPHRERKRAIARYAASMCHDGETIAMGGGTTTYGLTEFLTRRHMRILTSSFQAARVLLKTSGNEVLLTGGTIYPRHGNLLHSSEGNGIAPSADKLFMGAHGLSMLGLLEPDPLVVQSGRRLIGQARQVIVLADSSKFGKKTGLFVCGIQRVSCVVTDSNVSDSVVQMLERAGTCVRIVAARSLR